MRITMITIGSTGDVRPYIILGSALKARGHDIAICAFSDFESSVVQAGLRFKPLRGDVKTFMARLMKGSNGVMFLKQAHDALIDLINPLLVDLETACDDCEAIIGTYLGQIFPSLAEVRHIPYIQTHYFPMDRNKLTPIASAPGQHVGKAWNVATYQLGYLLISILEKYHLSEWRESHGMTPRKLVCTPQYELNGHTIPVLYAISPLVLPRPADWGANIHMTGYWLSNTEEDFTPEPELQAFLDAGSKPIYIGFGSMVNNEMGEVLDIVLQSLKRSGVRAVLSKGWGGVALPKDENIFEIDYAPHNWLFKQMAAVVHHGGAGTTAAGILAGCPTLIIPFGGDQPFWGARVQSLGIGPKPIPREKLSVYRLTRALTELTETKKYRVAVRELAQRLRSENGVQTAADLIEHELRKWLREEGREPTIVPPQEG